MKASFLLFVGSSKIGTYINSDTGRGILAFIEEASRFLLLYFAVWPFILRYFKFNQPIQNTRQESKDQNTTTTITTTTTATTTTTTTTITTTTNTNTNTTTTITTTTTTNNNNNNNNN